ncbi:MAG TPA: laminin G domain-containing protein [Actinomycetales bacterium]|nr:laminin G domain-containing protein [Actinomycetales bacterium]
MRGRRAAVLGVAAASMLGLSLPAAAVSAPPGSTVALWQMDEGPGAKVMVDSGSAGLNGSIGGHVTTGVTYDGATGYRFPRLQPNTPPADPEHLVTVPDAPFLDPGDASFYAIEIRYRTTNKFGNLIQKGQSTARGGQFKIQLPKGRPSCYFKGPLGRVGAGAKSPINDGNWHVLRCEHTPTSTTFYVDGVRVGRKNGQTGTIDNKVALTIGGKPNCDQIKITCDYFGGDIDYVKIEKG